MDWQSLPKGFLGAVDYSTRFNFPLTPHEIWFWQVGTNYSKNKVPSSLIKPVNRSSLEKISRQKWTIATKNIPILSHNPFILAIFITGSLAVNNCTPNDDIDLMIISAPHTLWLSRLWSILSLSYRGLRRPSHLPEHSSPKVKDTFCDNLYLDLSNLHINEQNLYIAHEILQARPLHDPHHLHRKFLVQNSWVKKYLPVAYRETLKSTPPTKVISNHYLPFTYYFLLNLIAFIIQYLYMFPKITHEKISLHQAFFHPHKSVI